MSVIITPEEYERELLTKNQSVKLDKMPQRRGKSKQTFGTPMSVLVAVQRQFGPIGIDLAATADNAVCENFISPEQDSLKQDWTQIVLPLGNIAWLNPPFADLDPWAKQLETVRFMRRWTLMLCPASVSCNWWTDHVRGKVVEFSTPRMQFVGSDSNYPKDLAILAAGFGATGYGFFDWRK